MWPFDLALSLAFCCRLPTRISRWSRISICLYKLLKFSIEACKFSVKELSWSFALFNLVIWSTRRAHQKSHLSRKSACVKNHSKWPPYLRFGSKYLSFSHTMDFHPVMVFYSLTQFCLKANYQAFLYKKEIYHRLKSWRQAHKLALSQILVGSWSKILDSHLKLALNWLPNWQFCKGFFSSKFTWSFLWNLWPIFP